MSNPQDRRQARLRGSAPGGAGRRAGWHGMHTLACSSPALRCRAPAPCQPAPCPPLPATPALCRQTAYENPKLWVDSWAKLAAAVARDPVSRGVVLFDLVNEPDNKKVRAARPGVAATRRASTRLHAPRAHARPSPGAPPPPSLPALSSRGPLALWPCRASGGCAHRRALCPLPPRPTPRPPPARPCAPRSSGSRAAGALGLRSCTWTQWTQSRAPTATQSLCWRCGRRRAQPARAACGERGFNVRGAPTEGPCPRGQDSATLRGGTLCGGGSRAC